VQIAERYERQHEERARVLGEKIDVQSREVALAEREFDEMKAELRTAMAVGPAVPGMEPLEDPLSDANDTARVREEINALARERARADRDADAAKRLEELKRKMGK